MDNKNNKDLINIIRTILTRIENIEATIERKIILDFMTIKEAAVYTRCSTATIREIIRSGQIKYYRINQSPKSTILIKRKDLRKFIINGKM